MKQVNIAEQQRMATLYRCLNEKKGSPPSWSEAGIKRFLEIGFPGRKTEMFTYFNTAKLGFPVYGGAAEEQKDDESIKGLLYPGFEKSCLVFSNGVFNKNLSNVSNLPVQILTVREEGKANPQISAELLASSQQENDPFAALNAAFSREVTIVDFQEGMQKREQLQILFHSPCEKKQPLQAHTPRVVLRIPAGAQLEIVARYAGSETPDFINSFQQIVIDKNATVHFLVDQSCPSQAITLVKNKISMGEGSSCFFSQTLSGGTVTRCHNEIILTGVGARFESRSASVLKGKEESHVFMNVCHAKKYCTSDQFFNNIVFDKGRGSVDTTVEVKTGAVETESGQLVKNTLLSKDARADTKPNLKIFTDDVKCQHGATTGWLDEKQILYMQSRGVRRARAKKTIITGLIDSMLTGILNKQVKELVRENLVKKIEGENVPI
ncbi:MAG: SufD family Fe-S cluster assembly protein [Nitrospinota bacterium]